MKQQGLEERAPEGATGRGRPVAFVALALLSLIGLEVLVRQPAVYERLPLPSPYYNPDVEYRRRALERLREKHGRIDVVFMGSSIVRTNISPRRFDRRIKESLGIQTISYNTGLSGVHPDGARLYFERFWLAKTRPKVVVQGVRLSGMQYEREASRELSISKGRIERRWMAGDPFSALVGAGIAHFRLSQYQGSLHDVLRALARRAPLATLHGRPAITMDEHGWGAKSLTLATTLTRGVVSQPDPYRGAIALETYAVGRKAIRRMAAICRDEGIDYVVANVPEHPHRHSAPDGAPRYQHYLETLTELAREEGFTFVDVTGGDPETFGLEELFSDYHHMRRPGALRFTDELAVALAPLIERRFGGE